MDSMKNASETSQAGQSPRSTTSTTRSVRWADDEVETPKKFGRMATVKRKSLNDLSNSFKYDGDGGFKV